MGVTDGSGDSLAAALNIIIEGTEPSGLTQSGTSARGVLVGYNLNDILIGGGSEDVLIGGAGSDQLSRHADANPSDDQAPLGGWRGSDSIDAITGYTYHIDELLGDAIDLAGLFTVHRDGGDSDADEFSDPVQMVDKEGRPADVVEANLPGGTDGNGAGDDGAGSVQWVTVASFNADAHLRILYSDDGTDCPTGIV